MVRHSSARVRWTTVLLPLLVFAVDPRPLSAAEISTAHRSDPLESVNRSIHAFNLRVSDIFLDPVVDWVEENVPPEYLHGARGIVENLEEPVTVVANLLAGDLDGADVASRRFLINTFMGYGGFVDVAEYEFGYQRDPADLRLPLCRYGVPPGPLIVLPVFGEAHLRDIVGRYVSLIALSEVLGLGYLPYRASAAAVRLIDDETLTAVDPDPLAQGPSYEEMRDSIFSNVDSEC